MRTLISKSLLRKTKRSLKTNAQRDEQLKTTSSANVKEAIEVTLALLTGPQGCQQREPCQVCGGEVENPLSQFCFVVVDKRLGTERLQGRGGEHRQHEATK